MSQPAATHPTAEQLAAQLAPEIKGKTVLVTGVSSGGLGAAFVNAIATAQPAKLIIAGRNKAKLEEIALNVCFSLGGVEVDSVMLDLSSLSSVREAARDVLGPKGPERIDVLVNNAGVMATDYALTADGVESQFATNHLGHFLFTNLIMGLLLKSEAPRVVNVASDGHRMGPVRFNDYNFDNGATYDRWTAYGQAKTANMLMALSLAEKLGAKGLHAFSLHPGVIMTNLATHVDWEAGELQAADRKLGNAEGWSGGFTFKTLEEGSATTVYAAFDPALRDHNGAYLQDCRLADPWTDTVRPWATSPVEAEKLWRLSEKLVGQEFRY